MDQRFRMTNNLPENPYGAASEERQTPEAQAVTLEAQVVTRGLNAWRDLKKDRTFEDWILVGEALEVGRIEAMNSTGANLPEGSRYIGAFHMWLDKSGFGDMDKTTRSHLSQLMKKREEIEAWRKTLTLKERLRINHPTAVLRKFKAATTPKVPSSKPTPQQQQKERIAELEDENRRLKADVEGWSVQDDDDEIALAWFNEFNDRSTIDKAERVANALLKLVEHSRPQGS